MDEGELCACFTTVVSVTRGERIEKKLTKAQAQGMYSLLFVFNPCWIMTFVNHI